MNDPRYDDDDEDDEELDQTIAFDMNDIEAALASPYEDDDDDLDDLVVDVEEELGLVVREEYVVPVPVQRPVQHRMATPPPQRRQQPIPKPKSRIQKQRRVAARPDLGPTNREILAGQQQLLNADQPTHVLSRKKAPPRRKVEKKSRVHLYYTAALVTAVVGFGAFYFNVYLPAIGKTFVLGIY